MADSLEHLDGDDFAEAALDMAVIGEEDLDPVRQPFFLHPPGGPVELLAGNRDSRQAAPGLPYRLESETAPAAADLKHMICRSDGRLVDNGLELVVLRLLEAVGYGREKCRLSRTWSDRERGHRDRC